ncbi:MAG: RNA polymerase sigma factor [Nannocystaceae bacterium]
MKDAELLAAWHGGDRAAGEALFERHYDGVSRFFRNKVAEPADLVQRTFLACLENVDRFRGDASFRTFVFAIANNVLHKHFRMRGGPRGKVDLGTVSAEDLGDSPSRVLVDGEQKQLLLRALRRLSVEQQVLLELHYWEQLKVTELAEVLTLPVGTVKTRLRAARKRLEVLIGELASTPDLGPSTVSQLDVWARDLREHWAEHPPRTK